MASSRLRAIGLEVPGASCEGPASHRLYELLAGEDPRNAHSRYNAIVRRLVSFARAAERARRPDSERIRRLAVELGDRAPVATKLYLTGGATAVLEGWRATTVDIDVRIEPESDELLRVISELKETLDLNIELAAPPSTPSPSCPARASALGFASEKARSRSSTSISTRRPCRRSSAASTSTSPTRVR